MRILLDTHVLLWFLLSPGRLSAAALAAIQREENQVYVSLVSAWEMSIKSSIGKLTLTQPIEPFILDQTQRNRFDILPITLAHIAAARCSSSRIKINCSWVIAASSLPLSPLVAST